MQFNKVLVLVTGQPSDKTAVSHAAALVRENRGRLIILYVIQVERSEYLDAELPEEVEKAEEILAEAELAANLQRNVIEGEMLQAREIGPAVVHEAAVRDIDAVVISTAYPRTHNKFSLGTDIPYILEYAACNVILIREEIAGARPERRPLLGRSGSTSGK
jgi:nucleotide-binding universal stress UspA family protein